MALAKEEPLTEFHLKNNIWQIVVLHGGVKGLIKRKSCSPVQVSSDPVQGIQSSKFNTLKDQEMLCEKLMIARGWPNSIFVSNGLMYSSPSPFPLLPTDNRRRLFVFLADELENLYTERKLLTSSNKFTALDDMRALMELVALKSVQAGLLVCESNTESNEAVCTDWTLARAKP